MGHEFGVARCLDNIATELEQTVRDEVRKPNYYESTLSLVQAKLERALYDQETPWDDNWFLLMWKTSKLVTLGCYFCRKMTTLNYATLEPRDGKRLHQFFDQHLGGGILF